MVYTPIKTSGKISGKNVTGTMPIWGVNNQDDSQLLDTRSALKIENYLVHGVAKLQKRPGQIVNFDTTESTLIPHSGEYRYDYDIIAYGTKVRAYDTTAGTFTDIKINFTTSLADWTGGRYGDYYFVNNSTDGLWRIYQQFTWAESYNLAGTNTFYLAKNVGTTIVAGQTLTDTTTGNTAFVVTATEPTTTSMILTVNTLSGVFTLSGAVTGGTLVGATLTNVNPFTAGLKITGATSGATAIILELTDSGATGSFVLGSITGTFLNGEVVTDTASGRALTTTATTFGITQVTNAPKAKIFSVIGKRGILANLVTDQAAYNYSIADTGTNPPFNIWATGTAYNDPGAGANRNGGACKDVALIGDIIFVGQENGWFAFQINPIDIGGVASKIDQEVSSRQNFPVYRCLMSNVGMIVTSSSGIWRLVSLGQPNIPYSDQWELLTETLGEEYFKDVTFTNTDTMYDSARGFVYVTLGKSSAVNNLVLSTKIALAGVENNVKTGATSFLTGWNILRFQTRGNSIYGTSALDGIRHELFTGQKDVQASIHSEYLQELNFGLTGAFNLQEFYTKGEMSPASELTITFDTFDEGGCYEPRRKTYTWDTRCSYVTKPPGWGEAAFGDTGWGGGAIASGLINDFTGAKPRLRQLSRVYLRYECDDSSEHFINWFSGNAIITKQIRNRNLTEIII